MSRTFLVLLPFLVAGCAQMPSPVRTGGGSGGTPATLAPAPAPVLRGPSATVASLDTVSEAEKDAARAAAAAASAGGDLGTVTVQMGNALEAGLWVKTALVDAETPGTVRTGDGNAIAVTLRPLGGAGGAQISLSALQALGLPLAGLHSVTLAAG